MAKKTYLAQDVLDFVNKGWPGPEGSWYFEEVGFLDDSNKQINFNDYSLQPGVERDLRVPASDIDGIILWQGKGEDPSGGGMSFIKELDKWLKRKTTTTLAVEVPNDKVEALKEAVKKLGGKVCK